MRRAQWRTRARVFRGVKRAHRHALPEPLGLSAQSQVPRARGGARAGALDSPRASATIHLRNRGSPGNISRGWVAGPSARSSLADTDSRTRISKVFEVARRSRVTTRPTTPKPNPNRAGSARARSHAPVCKLWLAWVFVGSKDTTLKIEREQKRGNRARARRPTIGDPARGVGCTGRTDRAGRARRRSSFLGLGN